MRWIKVLFPLALIGVVAFFAADGQFDAKAQAPAARQVAVCPKTAPKKEYHVITGEWDTTLGVDLADRGVARKKGEKLERYTFDPGMLVAEVGDCVVLNIHDVKGKWHNVDIPMLGITSEDAPLLDNTGKVAGRASKGRPNPGEETKATTPTLPGGWIVRGEEVRLTFTVNKPGLYEILCEIHDTAYATKDRPEIGKKAGDALEGPMMGHLVVLSRAK